MNISFHSSIDPNWVARGDSWANKANYDLATMCLSELDTADHTQKYLSHQLIVDVPNTAFLLGVNETKIFNTNINVILTINTTTYVPYSLDESSLLKGSGVEILNKVRDKNYHIPLQLVLKNNSKVPFYIPSFDSENYSSADNLCLCTIRPLNGGEITSVSGPSADDLEELPDRDATCCIL